MHQCLTCFKTFSSNQMLKYHTVNKVCLQHGKNVSCVFCSKLYKTKYTFLRHLNKKHMKKKVNLSKNPLQKPPISLQNPPISLQKPPISLQNPPNLLQNPPNLLQNPPISLQNPPISLQNPPISLQKKEQNKQDKQNKLKCIYCYKNFTRKDNLKRHIKHRCKKRDIKIINNNEITNNKKNNITTNINNNNNILNNISNNTYNVTINNFGREKMDSISDKDIFRCINKCYEGVPELFKLIHIDTPENRNLYLTNIKNPYIFTYNNNKWEIDELNKILDCIKKDKKDIIEEYIENNNNKFKQYKIKNIYKMLKDYNEGHLEKRYNCKLKLILLNNKDILKNTYEGKL